MAMNVLLVEDDQNVREVLELVIDSLGYKIKSVSSAESAIEYLNQNQADVVISDLNLGYGKNGHELLSHIQQNFKGLDVVIISAQSSAKDSALNAVRSMRGGAYYYMAKPINIADLEAILSEIGTSREKRNVLGSKSLSSLEDFEKSHIVDALNQAESYEMAAEKLGINLSTLWRKRKQYGIPPLKKVKEENTKDIKNFDMDRLAA